MWIREHRRSYWVSLVNMITRTNLMLFNLGLLGIVIGNPIEFHIFSPSFINENGSVNANSYRRLMVFWNRSVVSSRDWTTSVWGKTNLISYISHRSISCTHCQGRARGLVTWSDSYKKIHNQRIQNWNSGSCVQANHWIYFIHFFYCIPYSQFNSRFIAK